MSNDEVNHFLSVTELEKFTHSFMDCCNVHCLGPSQKSISYCQLIKKKSQNLNKKTTTLATCQM